MVFSINRNAIGCYDFVRILETLVENFIFYSHHTSNLYNATDTSPITTSLGNFISSVGWKLHKCKSKSQSHQFYDVMGRNNFCRSILFVRWRQSYVIKSAPWTILWFRILGIFSVENIKRLCVFMFQTWDNSQLLRRVLWISAELTIVSSLKHKNTQPLYIFNRVRVLHIDRLKEGTWLHSFAPGHIPPQFHCNKAQGCKYCPQSWKTSKLKDCILPRIPWWNCKHPWKDKIYLRTVRN